MNYKNIAQAKAIELKNKERLLKVNPKLSEQSGIYMLWRTEIHGYVGQSVNILTRLAQHLVGFQHIDLSLKKHGLFSETNRHGYKVDFIPFPKSELDEMEREYIQKCLDAGWILKNKTSGGQDEGKTKIAEYRPQKGYRDGLKQGYKNASREIAHLFEKHLDFCTKSDKPNKNAEKAVEKFKDFLEFYKGGGDQNE